MHQKKVTTEKLFSEKNLCSKILLLLLTFLGAFLHLDKFTFLKATQKTDLSPKMMAFF
jgi:hypothetical protein